MDGTPTIFTSDCSRLVNASRRARSFSTSAGTARAVERMADVIVTPAEIQENDQAAGT